VSAVAFQVELAPEDVVDRFDDLRQRLEEEGCWSERMAFAGGAQQFYPGVDQVGLEPAAVVVLVRDQDLSAPVGEQGGVPHRPHRRGQRG
jgi:hypothetical protein